MRVQALWMYRISLIASSFSLNKVLDDFSLSVVCAHSSAPMMGSRRDWFIRRWARQVPYRLIFFPSLSLSPLHHKTRWSVGELIRHRLHFFSGKKKKKTWLNYVFSSRKHWEYVSTGLEGVHVLMMWQYCRVNLIGAGEGSIPRTQGSHLYSWPL